MAITRFTMGFNHRRSITFQLSQTARAYRARAGNNLARIGLHPGQESLLKALGEDDGLSMSDLAAQLAVQPPTVTKMVSRLAAQGYLERRQSTGDGRQAHIFLTERGRLAITMIDKLWKRVEKEALAGIEDRDRRRLRRLLRQVERNLGGIYGPADELDDAEEEAQPVSDRVESTVEIR